MDRDAAVLAFQDYFESLSDEQIEKVRASFEEMGLCKIIPYRDPHLYAVLKPTRQENLDRIGNIISNLEINVLKGVLGKLEPFEN